MQTADQRIHELQDDNDNQVKEIKNLTEELTEWEIRSNNLLEQVGELEARIDVLRDALEHVSAFASQSMSKQS
jgi:hypothetical protein